MCEGCVKHISIHSRIPSVDPKRPSIALDVDELVVYQVVLKGTKKTKQRRRQKEKRGCSVI